MARLARMERFTTAWTVVLLGTAIGLYLVAAVACGLVIEWVAPLPSRASRRSEAPSVGHHMGAKPDV